MIAVVDANFFFNGKLSSCEYDVGYTTSFVLEELKDSDSKSLAILNSYKIRLRNPQENFVQKVLSSVDTGLLSLSKADISVVALCMEIEEEKFDTWITQENMHGSAVCLTDDNGILQALSQLGIGTSRAVIQKTYKIRCYACFALYDTYMDFCKRCGYQTLTRISVSQCGDEMKLHFKKGFKFRQKTLRGANGEVIRSEDQKEYRRYRRRKEKSVSSFFSNFN